MISSASSAGIDCVPSQRAYRAARASTAARPGDVVTAPSRSRGSGEYVGEARGSNIIAASIEAYIVALNAMLAEAHWTGAPEAAAVTGKRARAKAPVTAGTARAHRAELDEESGEIDTTDWFNRQG